MRRMMLIMGLLTLAAVWLSSLPQMAEPTGAPRPLEKHTLTESAVSA